MIPADEPARGVLETAAEHPTPDVPTAAHPSSAGDVRRGLLGPMDGDPPVGPGVDQERAARHGVQHGESSVAVVDREGRFRGLSRKPS